MIRLHVWTIVTDLCISAEADRPAPAVVHRLLRLHQVAAYSGQSGSVRNARFFLCNSAMKALFCDGHHITNAVPARPHEPFAPITISLTVEYRLLGASPDHAQARA